MSSNLVFNNFEDDNIPRSGFMDKNEILSYVSEQDIYELVFGFKPEEFDKVCSPLRVDFNPGAYFERTPTDNRLFFIDWGDPKKSLHDCFDVVQRYFNLPNFYQTLSFVKEYLIDGRKLAKRDLISHTPKKPKKTDISFQTRAYLLTDKIYWEKYEITIQQLLEDRVMAVSKIKIVGKKGTNISTPYTPCYAYTEFDSGNRKLYFPYREGSKRFLTNCSKNDIGGLHNLDLNDPQLIITKSYKDYRVLKNQGYNCVWFQNEGMTPDMEFLDPLISSFSDVIVFFDNDKTGIEASIKLVEKLQLIYGKGYSLYLPTELLVEGIKDPSDLIAKKGRQELLNFLNSNI